ncbi:family 16 glycosylhydrolase [Sediminitomix flava]|uniref:Putative secreted protein (Por secretion system target) n=1 Tax=Sediminitomix flava TaxID=379075 RepID=A0A315Z2D7_SEDFL|nr:family 16 glycosylhydrolase [Sediminitomix flava]PWJ36160.1 putative secreted protein (Por secretion system target) [Sediminitomix flava]
MRLKEISILFFLLTQFTLSYAQEDCVSLVWSDEFNYSGLPDQSKWGYDVGGNGWGNGEAQFYTENRLENARVENGKLIIEARKESMGGSDYTSARLVTRDKGDWLYGRFEIKAKLPTGRGTWPAIWMLPTDWEYGGWPDSGEIDIMEHVGHDPAIVHGTVHTKAYYHSIGTQKGGSTMVDDFNTAFHVYAIEWSEEEIVWYIDDVEYFRFKNEHKTYKEWPFDKRFHLLLNIAVGGSWGGAQGIDDTIFPQRMEVDYVRVYGYNPEAKITGADFLEKDTEATFETNIKEGNTYQWSFPEGVEILEGENSDIVKVKWGNIGGTVSVDVQTECDAYTAEKEVRGYTIPEGDMYILDHKDTEGSLRWKAVLGDDSNSIQLTEESDGSIRVDFDIPAPRGNPHLELELFDLLDLSTYRKVSMAIKADNAPENIRLDLYDYKELYNLENVFDSFNVVEGEEFFDYIHFYGVEGKETSGFSLDKIQTLKLYFNYSFLAGAKSGTFWLKPLVFTIPAEGEDQVEPEQPEEPQNPVTGVEDDLFYEVVVYPIPAKEELFIKNLKGNEQLTLIDIVGNQSELPFDELGKKEWKVKLPSVTQGIYFLQITSEEGSIKTFRILIEK